MADIRNIAEVNVEMIPEIDIKTGETITVKDVFSNIFNDKNNYTMNEEDWKKTNTNRTNTRRSGQQGGPASTPQGKRQKDEIKKFWVSSTKTGNTGGGGVEDDKGKATPDLTLMGNALVLTPAILDPQSSDIYATKLEKSESYWDLKVLGADTKPVQVTSGSVPTTAVAGNPQRSGAYSSLETEGEDVKNTNSDDTKRIYTNTTVDDTLKPNEKGLAKKITPNIWSTNDITDPSQIQMFFGELQSTGEVYHGDYARSPDEGQKIDETQQRIFPISAIQSKFFLRKNQPFSIAFDTTRIPKYSKKKYTSPNRIVNPVVNESNPDDPKNNPSLSKTIGQNLKLLGASAIGNVFTDEMLDGNIMVIEWGATNKDEQTSKYALAFHYKTQKWSLYKETEGKPPVYDAVSGEATDTKNEGSTDFVFTTVDAPTTIPGIKERDRFQLVVYPLGNQLVISNNIPNQYDEKQKKGVASFQLGEDTIIGESQIKIYFYGDFGTKFNFKPIYHRPAGELVSTVKNLDVPPAAENADIFSNLDFVGKVGLARPNGDTQSWTDFTFPSDDDKEKLYGYLENTIIRLRDENAERDDGTLLSGLSNDANRKRKQFYRFNLQSNQNYADVTRDSDKVGEIFANFNEEDLNRLERQFSPIVFTGEVNCVPAPETIQLVNGETKLSFVKNVNINQNVEGYTGNVVLYNRQTDPAKREGLYTTDTRIKGIKPIKVEAKIKTDSVGIAGFNDMTNEIGDPTVGQYIRLFTGYIDNRTLSRSGSDANSSTVTLPLVDSTLRAKDTIVVNLPIFDGWCNLAVIYWLGRYAGYSDDELMLWQDPLNEGNNIRLVDTLTGGPGLGATFRGECFNGHVKGFPRGDLNRPGGSQSIAGENLHACLPLGGFFDAPNYMFQMGSSVWDCMLEIAEFTGFFLFANNWGSICYTPGELALTGNVDFEFVEQPGDATDVASTNIKFNEILRTLTVDHPMEEVRNAVISQGLMFGNEPTDIYPIVMVQRQPGWPNNVDDPTYIPWLRFAIQRNPHWNDPSRLKWNNDQLFYRISRQRDFASWSAWGRGLFPYQTFQVDETHLKEVLEIDTNSGRKGVRYIAASVNHVLDADQFMWTASIEGEKYENEYKFSPHVA